MNILRKISRILFFIALGILVIIIVLNFFADPLVKRTLEKQVAKAGNGQYSLNLEDLHFSLFKGDLLLKGVKFETDTSRNFTDPVLFTEVDGASVEGFSLLGWLLNDALILEKLKLSNGSILLSIHPESEPGQADKPFTFEKLDIYPLIKDDFDKIQINDLELENIELAVESKNKEGNLQLSFHVLDIKVKDILVEEDMLFTASRTFYSEGIEIEGKELEYVSAGRENIKTSIGSLYFTTQRNKAGLALSTVDFLQQDLHAKDTLLFFNFQDFNLQELRVNKLQEEKIAELEGVLLNEMEFVIHSDSFKDEKENPKKDSSKYSKEIKEFSAGLYLPAFLKKIEVADLNLRNISGKQGNSFWLEDGSLAASNLMIDESPAFSDNRFFHFKKIDGHVGQLKFSGGQAGHQGKFNNIKLGTENGITNVGLDHFSLVPSRKRLDENWVEIETKSIQMDSLITKKIPLGEVHLEKLAVRDPRVVLFLPYQISRKEAGAKKSQNSFGLEKMNISPVIREYIDQLSIGNFLIKDLNLELINMQNTGSLEIASPNISLNSHGILIGPQEAFTKNSSFYSTQLAIAATNLSIKQKGASTWEANFKAASTSLNHNMAAFSLHSLAFYQGENSYKDTLLEVNLDNFNLNGLDLNRLLRNKYAEIEKLAFSDLDVYDNNRSPSPSEPGEPEGEKKKKLILSSLNLGNYLPDPVQFIDLQELNIQNVSFRQNSSGLELNEGSLAAKHILIDGKPAFAGNRFFHASRLESHLQDVSFPSGEGSHELKFESLNFGMDHGSGSLSIQQILSVPRKKNVDSLWLEAEMSAIKLKGINTKELDSGFLMVDHLAFDQPTLVLHTPSEPSDAPKSTKETSVNYPDLYPLIKDYLEAIKINKLNMNDGNLRFSGLGDSYYGLHLPKLNLAVENFLVAPETAFMDDRLFHSADIRLNVQDMHYLFPDRVYSLQLDNASFSTSGDDLELEGLLYTYSENYKAKLAEDSTNEVYRIYNKILTAEAVNWKKLLLGEGFEAEKLTSEGLDVYVYKDFNVPYTDQPKPMPSEIVLGIELPLSIKELKLNEMEVIYEEMKQGADTAGFVKIEELEGTIYNLTNVDSILQQIPAMEVAASGRLMGKGYFQSHISVPLLDPSSNIRVTGSMDTLDITELNRIARYNSRIALKSGAFYKINWDFEAGEEQSKGTVAISYENLKVQLSQPNSPDTTGFFKDIGSFLINTLVVDSNIAEGKNKEPEKVSFNQKRDKERSFFHFYVQSLLAGFIEAIGIPFQ